MASIHVFLLSKWQQQCATIIIAFAKPVYLTIPAFFAELKMTKNKEYLQYMALDNLPQAKKLTTRYLKTINNNNNKKITYKPTNKIKILKLN